VCLFSSPEIFRCFLLVEREGLDLECDLRGRGHIFVLVLFTLDLESSFFSFKREGLDLKGLSLRERKFDLRESLGGREES